jgi:hypothetical protein
VREHLETRGRAQTRDLIGEPALGRRRDLHAARSRDRHIGCVQVLGAGIACDPEHDDLHVIAARSLLRGGRQAGQQQRQQRQGDRTRSKWNS